MPSVSIGVLIDKAFARSVRSSWVRRVLRHVLSGVRIGKGWISVMVTDNQKIRRYNRRYLRHDYATDVIAFGPSKECLFGGQPRYIGDLVVSAQKARQISGALGIRFDEELARYLIHGT
ncbi:MAG: rRNA maturation RNase YbeY, partial [Candidatus Omnitrophota bacterium]